MLQGTELLKARCPLHDMKTLTPWCVIHSKESPNWALTLHAQVLLTFHASLLYVFLKTVHFFPKVLLLMLAGVLDDDNDDSSAHRATPYRCSDHEESLASTELAKKLLSRVSTVYKFHGFLKRIAKA